MRLLGPIRGQHDRDALTAGSLARLGRTPTVGKTSFAARRDPRLVTPRIALRFELNVNWLV